MDLATSGFLALGRHCTSSCWLLREATAVSDGWPAARHRATLTLLRLGQGILFSTAEILKTPLDLARLCLHEAERVYGDKMVDEKDQETLRRVTIASTKKFFDVGQATGSLC